MSKIAELTMELECGGKVVTYLKCKDEKHLLRKLEERYQKGWMDFGHVKVDDAAIVFSDYKLHWVH